MANNNTHPQQPTSNGSGLTSSTSMPANLSSSLGSGGGGWPIGNGNHAPPSAVPNPFSMCKEIITLFVFKIMLLNLIVIISQLEHLPTPPLAMDGVQILTILLPPQHHTHLLLVSVLNHNFMQGYFTYCSFLQPRGPHSVLVLPVTVQITSRRVRILNSFNSEPLLGKGATLGCLIPLRLLPPRPHPSILTIPSFDWNGVTGGLDAKCSYLG